MDLIAAFSLAEEAMGVGDAVGAVNGITVQPSTTFWVP